MNKVANFFKVSKERYIKDFKEHIGDVMEDEYIEKIWENITLPERKTVGSAGYDFAAPFEIYLKPGKTIMIPTGIRCEMNPGTVLMLFPRSGIGSRCRLQLNNTVGIIDSDYFYSDNEGHILAKITNDSNEGRVVSLVPGDGFMQGVFLQFGITTDDYVDGIRNGGMGSTDRRETCYA